MKFPALAIAIIASVLSLQVGAHSGKFDSKGCHNDRKHGGYHCHRAQPTVPQKPTSPKAAAPKAAKPKSTDKTK